MVAASRLNSLRQRKRFLVMECELHRRILSLEMSRLTPGAVRSEVGQRADRWWKDPEVWWPLGAAFAGFFAVRSPASLRPLLASAPIVGWVIRACLERVKSANTGKKAGAAPRKKSASAADSS